MQLPKLLKLSGKFEKDLFQINLLFIFIFINIWDYIVSRQLINGMVIGVLMFGPSALLWLIGTIRAIALLTLVSIFEFLVILVFVLEGLQLSGAGLTLKTIFWVPYLLVAGINGFWGLKIYSENREKKLGGILSK